MFASASDAGRDAVKGSVKDATKPAKRPSDLARQGVYKGLTC